MSPRCLRCRAGSEWIEGSPLDAHANVLLLRAEVRALRRERREMRKALREIAAECKHDPEYQCTVCVLTESALKPWKARRAGRTK